METANKLDVNRRRKIIMFIISMVFTISCSITKFLSDAEDSKFPNDPLVDRSFMTGQPCEAPCWYGLRVNESTIDDIHKTIPNLPFANENRIYEQPTGDFGPNEKWISIPCIYSETLESCADLETSSDGTLQRIILRIDYNLPLRSVVQKLGNPEYYTTNPSPNSDICSLEINWPEKDIGAVVNEGPRAKHCSNDKKEQVDLDLQVVSLVYLEISPADQRNAEKIPWKASVP